MNCLLLAMLLAGADAPAANRPFAIEIVDQDTGRGVPLVELETTNNLVYVTDSRGVAAFDEPGLLGQPVWFHVRSHGYEFAADAFGYRGQRIETTPGGQTKLKIKRLNIAERLCRLTGGGIERDSVLTGRMPAESASLLNGQVLGCDSIMTGVYKGRMYHFWGDTNRPAYPLGNFHMTGATSPLPAELRNISHGIRYDYFTDDTGFARGVCKMPGDGPTWLDGIVVLAEPQGRERMFGAYVKIKPPLSTYQRGLCEWNDDRNEFVKLQEFPLDAPVYPFGRPFKHADHVYFADPFPCVRMPANVESFTKLDDYEAFTCLVAGTRFADQQVERDAQGRVVYGWKRNTPTMTAEEERKLVTAGKLPADAAHWQLAAADTGKPVIAHRGSVRWNEYRKRWILITVEIGGSSMLGEVWYAESDQPTGPFGKAVKVVTHNKYSFYNPLHHVEFDAEGGRMIHFEGTYTHTFSGNSQQTPRYDYNQMLYRLDLSDARLSPTRK
ncbi:MAG TPA: hypothetical protein VM165_13900 [Planctomycetaceae bacterium]|nr:hypothetical protein [Planctomycetaceae bacterium]